MKIPGFLSDILPGLIAASIVGAVISVVGLAISFGADNSRKDQKACEAAGGVRVKISGGGFACIKAQVIKP